MTSQEEQQPGQPNAQAAAEPQTHTPNEQPPAQEQAPAQQQPPAQEQAPAEPAQAQAQPPQPPPVQPPPPPYPFAPVPKLPWIAPARKGAVIAIGIAVAVVMFGAGIGAGAAIFHNDRPSRPSVEYRLPDFGQRQFPGFPHRLPTPSPAPSRTS